MKKALSYWALMSAVLFTLLTLISSTLSLIMGNTHDTHAHILMRFSFVMIGSLATIMYLFFPLKHKILRYILPYVVAQGMVFLTLFLIGFLSPLHPDAYRDAFFNFTFVAIPIILSLIVFDVIKVRKLKMQT